ncbi:MAG: hypothetical protein JWM56_448 [Candidatus Peribacteria bacterium]|nr:hypothetical protein [Candidatus Peribacteria bacterium]
MVEETARGRPVTFQGKDPGEDFQFYYRQHWIRLGPYVLRMVLISLAVFGIGILLLMFIGITEPIARRAVLVFLLCIFIMTQLDFLSRFYKYFLHVVIITDRKVHRIKKTLLATNEHESVDLWVLQDIRKSQRGIIQNMLGYGTIILEAQNTTLRLHFTPRIDSHYHQIIQMRERARQGLTEQILEETQKPKQ